MAYLYLPVSNPIAPPVAASCCNPAAMDGFGERDPAGLDRALARRTHGAAQCDGMRSAARSLLACFCLLAPVLLHAQMKAQLPAGPMTPPWDKGIQPISRDSYWNAVECGKQKGARPGCVFYDADLCKNDDFTLAMYTPYKSVAYEVWRVIKNGQPAPTPS